METNTIEQKKTTRGWYKLLVIFFVVIIVLGFAIFFVLRYLSIESKKPNSLIGQAWIDFRTTAESDVDQDGLSNADEKSYATDFWISDSDGDGFSDGQEVKNGYNPVGSGRLDDKDLSFDLSILGK